jgi:hypothetical protein
MQVLNTIRPSFGGWAKSKVAAVVAVASAAVLPLAAQAQAVTDPFTTAMADATTKVATYAAALVGLAAVGVVFMIAMKYVKKIPRAS